MRITMHRISEAKLNKSTATSEDTQTYYVEVSVGEVKFSAFQ